VDRVLELKPGATGTRVGRKVRALKNVTVGESHFVGHFPDRPVMPGVLIVEAMAQAGALAFFDPTYKDVNVAIAAVNRAKFRKPVVPGDSLILCAEIKKHKAQMVVIQCEAYVDDVRVAEAEILAFVDFKKPLN
jgi:beta-hydroxyacyl-ACP dehydratase FabZ